MYDLALFPTIGGHPWLTAEIAVVIVLVGQRAIGAWRRRPRTVRVIEERECPEDARAIAAEDQVLSTVAPDPPAELAERAAPVMVGAIPIIEEDDDPVEDWANGRPICPCCGCATDYDQWSTCSLCDWEEPLSPRPGWELAGSERNGLLAEARDRYRTTGSAIADDDRASWGGDLTSRERELRTRLRERCDYLRAGERPDASETWEEVDRLLEALRAEAERKRRDTD